MKRIYDYIERNGAIKMNLDERKVKSYTKFFTENFKEGTEEWAYDLYENEKPIPGLWYVHGGKIQKDYVIQCTKDWHTAKRYGRNGNQIWLVKPNRRSKILDFRRKSNPDFRKLIVEIIEQIKDESWRGLEANYEEIYNSLMFNYGKLRDIRNKKHFEQIKEDLWRSFSPVDIVEYAGAYDSPEWVRWLTEYFEPDFILTQNDGAVANGSDAEFDRIKISI